MSGNPNNAKNNASTFKLKSLEELNDVALKSVEELKDIAQRFSHVLYILEGLREQLDESEKKVRKANFQLKGIGNQVKESEEQLQKELVEKRNALQELDELKSCKICNELYNDTERETVKLECPHVFCKKCVIQFQQTCNSQCPFCRKFFGQFYPVKF